MGAESNSSCTTHINVVDKKGNMASLTQTLLSIFGSRVVLPKSGILMNNGIMWFDPTLGKPNSIRPGTKPLCNMCPTLVFDKLGNKISLGASGGRKIFPAIMQLISFVLDHKMSLDEAFKTARIDFSGENRILANSSLKKEILMELSKLKTTIKVQDAVLSGLFACPNAVMENKNKQRFGSSYIPSPKSKVLSTDKN